MKFYDHSERVVNEDIIESLDKLNSWDFQDDQKS